MKVIKKISGSLVAVIFCLLTIPTAIFWPELQLEAISNSSVVLSFVQENLVDQNSTIRCDNELNWINFIYLVTSLSIAVIFYVFQYKKQFSLFLIFILLAIQFYILQTPFFIFEVGTYYNCQIDGQTILGIWISSPKVSFMMIPFGIAYDLVNRKIDIEQQHAIAKDVLYKRIK